MIIHLEQEKGSQRFIPPDTRHMVGAFFQGASVAFSKARTGDMRFDTTLTSNEDMDFGIRAANKGGLFFNHMANVRHTSDLSFAKMLTQWLLIALYSVTVLHKHIGKHTGLEFHIRTSRQEHRETYFRPFLTLPAPCIAIVFLTPFFFMHCSLLLVFTGMICSSKLLVAVGVFTVLISAGLYLRYDLKKRDLPVRKRLSYLLLRLTINLILLYVSFLRGLQYRMVYISYDID